MPLFDQLAEFSDSQTLVSGILLSVENLGNQCMWPWLKNQLIFGAPDASTELQKEWECYGSLSHTIGVTPRLCDCYDMAVGKSVPRYTCILRADQN